jgi:DNA-directed RNA polymerase specialized sigma24 family protein
MNNQTTNNTKTTTTKKRTKKRLTKKELAQVQAYNQAHKTEQTATAEPLAKIAIDYYANRNALLNTDEQTTANNELINHIATKAVWNTLKYLVNQNATNTATTDDIQAKRDEKTPLGYNMALRLLQDLPQDLAILRTKNANTSYQNAIDLYQEVCVSIVPFICSSVELNDNTTVYTKVLKNGNEKDYTLYKLACLSVRRYIENQAQRTYKKQGYLIGYTDEGKPIYTTKKPQDDINDIDTASREKFLAYYDLTVKEQDIIKHYINGLSVSEIAEQVNMTFEGTKKALYRAKQTIKATAKQNKMIK